MKMNISILLTYDISFSLDLISKQSLNYSSISQLQIFYFSQEIFYLLQELKLIYLFSSIHLRKSKELKTISKQIMYSSNAGQIFVSNEGQFMRPRCPGNNQASRMCLNPNCENSSKGKKIKTNEEKQDLSKENNNPFICSNHQCKICFYVGDNSSSPNKKFGNRLGIHSKCCVGEYESLLASLQQKKKDCEPLKKSINKIFDDFIDYLSELRQEYIEEINYYGLSEDQRTFFSCFQNGKYDLVTSQLGFSIIKSLDQQIQVDIFQVKQKLENYWIKQEKNIKKFFENVGNFIFKEITVNIASIRSKIMVSDKQKEDLIMMLSSQQEKPVKGLNLLYRASQNDFDVKKFHQKCDLIENTVVVIQTEHGKKIGGYTPIAWDGRIMGQYSQDFTGKSFIFSLTNNHKLILLKSQERNAICQHPDYGPIFGNGHDICIANKGNVKDCGARIGCLYTHPEYKCDQTSWKKFSGANGGEKFKVKDWELFQVKWNRK